jgi:hypothetical protein
MPDDAALVARRRAEKDAAGRRPSDGPWLTIYDATAPVDAADLDGALAGLLLALDQAADTATSPPVEMAAAAP